MNSPFSDDLISAYLDGELSPEQRAYVEKRLRERVDLRRVCDELQVLRHTLQALPVAEPPDNLVERILRQAERRLLSDESVPAAAPARSAPGPAFDAREGSGRKVRTWTVAASFAAALAATLLVVVWLPRQSARHVAQGPEARPEAAPASALVDGSSASRVARDEGQADELTVSLGLEAAPAPSEIASPNGPSQLGRSWDAEEGRALRRQAGTDADSDLPAPGSHRLRENESVVEDAAARSSHGQGPGGGAEAERTDPGMGLGDYPGMGGGAGMGAAGAMGGYPGAGTATPTEGMEPSFHFVAPSPQKDTDFTPEQVVEQIVSQLNQDQMLLVRVQLPEGDVSESLRELRSNNTVNWLTADGTIRPWTESPTESLQRAAAKDSQSVPPSEDVSLAVDRAAVASPNVLVVDGSTDQIRQSLNDLAGRRGVQIQPVLTPPDTYQRRGISRALPVLDSAETTGEAVGTRVGGDLVKSEAAAKTDSEAQTTEISPARQPADGLTLIYMLFRLWSDSTAAPPPEHR